MWFVGVGVGVVGVGGGGGDGSGGGGRRAIGVQWIPRDLIVLGFQLSLEGGKRGRGRRRGRRSQRTGILLYRRYFLYRYGTTFVQHIVLGIALDVLCTKRTRFIECGECCGDRRGG